MKALLIQILSEERPVVRDMAGGLGFDGGPAIVLPPLELMTMAAYLRTSGYDVELIDMNIAPGSRHETLEAVKRFAPQVIITTVSLPSLRHDCAFIRNMRESVSATIIVKTGITYPSLVEDILRTSTADCCIFGECADRIAQIIASEECDGVARIVDGVFSMRPNRIISDLDGLMLPCRDLVHNAAYHYVFLGDAVATMQTSRGCPFVCAYYCPYPLVQGKEWRAQSAQRVLQEIEDIVHTHGLHKILFRDAVFTLHKERVTAICRGIIRKKIDIQWWCETRVDCLDQELVSLMKEAGCMGMNIGVETGDPDLMRTEAKVGLTVQKLERLCVHARRIGLQLHFLLMIGLPHETPATVYKTYELVARLKPASIGICIVTPYPGTPLFEEASRKGWIETRDWTQYGGHSPVMHTDTLTSDDLAYVRDTIQRLFYAQRGGLRQRLFAFFERGRFKAWAQGKAKRPAERRS